MEKVTRENFENIIYISHPFGGNPSNVEKVSEIIQSLQRAFPRDLFISPINCFSFLYDQVDYHQGILFCLYLLEQCDEMWIVSEEWLDSTGCCLERDYCEAHNIPYSILSFSESSETKKE